METSDLNRPKEDAVAQALEAMWRKFLPDIGARVDLLAAAAHATATGALNREQRAAAHAAAHQLAGTLGTFGLARGTVVARELEMRLGGDGLAPGDARDMERSVAELRAVVAGRK